MDKMKIGFIGFGEVNTPIELLISNVNDAKERLAHNGILILCVAVWIPIYALIPTEDAFKNVPMILWGLCGGNGAAVHVVTTVD